MHVINITVRSESHNLVKKPPMSAVFIILSKRRYLPMRDFSIDLVWAKLQMAITAVGGVLGYFLGGMDGMLTALIIFAVLDYVTGLMCAVAEKKLSSSVGFKGICKKILIFMLVGVAHIVDMHVIGNGNALRTAVVCFYLSNEGISLLENAAHIGLPIPAKLKEILAQLHDRNTAEPNTDQSGEEHLPEARK